MAADKTDKLTGKSVTDTLRELYPPEVKHADLYLNYTPKTQAEAHFDTLIAARRQLGRKTYGQGLDHTDKYNWNVMALEEALDMCQYLAAQNLRVLQALRKLGQHATSCSIVADGDADCDCGLYEALHGFI